MKNRIRLHPAAGAAVLTAVLAFGLARPTACQAPSARDLLHQALAAMGGERLAALRTVRRTGFASDELLGVSRRSGPTIPMYRDFSELRDLAGMRLRRTSTVSLPMRPAPIEFTEVYAQGVAVQLVGERTAAGSPSQALEHSAWLRHGVERAIPAALAAADLRRGADTVLGGRRVATVIHSGGTVRLFLGTEDHLLHGVEQVQRFPRDAIWEMWGPVRTLEQYTAWAVLDGGIRLPYVIDVSRNGRPLRRYMIRELTLGVAAPDDSFPVTSELAAAFSARDTVVLGNGAGEPSEIHPGIVMIPGSFDVYLVRQDEGVVVLGSPHSREYSRLVLTEAARRFPGVPVRALVAGSATWPHLAGVGEYADRGIPVYASPETAALVTDVLRGESTRAATIRVVDSVTSLGAGANRMLLIGTAGPGVVHTDQLVSYFPEYASIFAADLLRPERFEPNLWLQPLAELRDVVAARGLVAREVFAIHLAPQAWDAALAPLLAAERAGP